MHIKAGEFQVRSEPDLIVLYQCHSLFLTYSMVMEDNLFPKDWSDCMTLHTHTRVILVKSD